MGEHYKVGVVAGRYMGVVLHAEAVPDDVQSELVGALLVDPWRLMRTVRACI